MMKKSTINWITFSNDDIQQARKIIKDLGPDATVDVIGLGIPFESISNILFPATSTLHTRLRYQIFVPAIFYKMYQESYKKKLKDPPKRLYVLENSLREVLEASGYKKDVIGSHAKEKLRYWPSQTYWGGINTMKIFGESLPSRSDLFDLISGAHDGKIENDDGGIEHIDEDENVFVDNELHQIALSLFENNSFKSDIKFSLTKKEATFFYNLFQNIDIGVDTLLNEWIKGTHGGSAGLHKISGFFNIPKTGNRKLDDLLNKSQEYSRIAIGISHAYRYALCRHRAENILKKAGSKSEWRSYAQNNLDNLKNWMIDNKELKKWDIYGLKYSLSEYGEAEKVDPELISLCGSFIQLWNRYSSSTRLAHEFSSIAKKQEYFRRGSRSHFEDPFMAISENTKGLENKEGLFDFRFKQGKSNALDILKGLGK